MNFQPDYFLPQFSSFFFLPVSTGARGGGSPPLHLVLYPPTPTGKLSHSLALIRKIGLFSLNYESRQEVIALSPSPAWPVIWELPDNQELRIKYAALLFPTLLHYILYLCMSPSPSLDQHVAQENRKIRLIFFLIIESHAEEEGGK